jgi:hypothetical protein|tara:strand:+ start:310 stop:546 length:237 start_codon:yes stop_codon:yes gene_type:complete
MVTAEKRRSAILSIFGQVIGFYGTFKAVLSVLKVIFELGSNRKKSTKDVEMVPPEPETPPRTDSLLSRLISNNWNNTQ